MVIRNLKGSLTSISSLDYFSCFDGKQVFLHLGYPFTTVQPLVAAFVQAVAAVRSQPGTNS